MTNELVLYEGEQDVKSLNSLTSESKNIKRIAFDFSSHKLLTQNNISHSILENYECCMNRWEDYSISLLFINTTLSIYHYNQFEKLLLLSGSTRHHS